MLDELERIEKVEAHLTQRMKRGVPLSRCIEEYFILCDECNTEASDVFHYIMGNLPHKK